MDGQKKKRSMRRSQMDSKLATVQLYVIIVIKRRNMGQNK